MLRSRRLVLPSLALALLAGLPGGARGSDADVRREAPSPSATQYTGNVVTTDSATAHYERVERELLAADVSGLTTDQREQRARAIVLLSEYRKRADFGINTDFEQVRMPYFVDDGGRRCAVAQLLHEFGEDEIVEQVARSANHVYVSDLAELKPFLLWLERVGLTLEEAARIQGPGMIWNDPPAPEDERPGDDFDVDENAGDDAEPQPGAGVDPVSNGPTGSLTGAGASRAGRTGPTTGGLGASGASAWWIWWELNKLDWMAPNRLDVGTAAVTGGGNTDDAREVALAALRDKHLPMLIAHLDDRDARVRASAAIAVGRVGGEQAVDALLPLLEDDQVRVREMTLLALGSTGSSDAADLLLRVAQRGTHKSRSKKELTPAARGVAIVGLALARAEGLDRPVETEVAALLAAVKHRDESEVGTAAVAHGLVAMDTALSTATVRAALDENATDALRARAVERRAVIDGAAALSDLQRALAGRELELRRSAAVALGGVDHNLVLPRLQTAYELEKEPLTRGFLLISIAERGGDDAVPFLATELEEAPGALRAWAALALGVVGSETGSESARVALRNADLPRALMGAVYAAQGIAGDTDAVGDLSDALADAANPQSRAYAATALGILGGDVSRLALLEQAGIEKHAAVRVSIAQALGVIGAGEDALFIASSLDDLDDQRLQTMAAVALGFHGSQEALEAAVSRASDADASSALRAASIEAMGLLLDREPGLVLPKLSRRTNFAVIPAWLQAVIQTTL